MFQHVFQWMPYTVTTFHSNYYRVLFASLFFRTFFYLSHIFSTSIWYMVWISAAPSLHPADMTEWRRRPLWLPPSLSAVFHRNKTKEGLSSQILLVLLFFWQRFCSLCLGFWSPAFLSHTSYQLPPPPPPLHPSPLSALVTSVNLVSLIQDQCIPLSHLWVLWMYYIKSLGSHCATAYV